MYQGDDMSAFTGSSAETQSKTVSSNGELFAAIEQLQESGGGTVYVDAAGGPYNLRLFQPGKETAAVTVTSLDPDDPAVFESVRLDLTQNLTFSGLSFDSSDVYGDRPGYVDDITVSRSSNITFENSIFRNVADGFQDGSGTVRWAENLAIVRDSDGFVFKDNDVSGYNQGVTVMDSDNTEIIGNSFTKMQADGVRLAGVQHTIVEDNSFTDFYGSLNKFNHDDMIQVWSVYAKQNTEDLVIRGNYMVTNGTSASQSIFILNETLPQTGIRYKDILIEENTIYNGHMHGVAVFGAEDVEIRNNTVLWNPEAVIVATKGAVGSNSIPQIRAEGTNFVIEKNIAGGVFLDGQGTVEDNAIIDYSNKASENYIDNHIANLNTGDALDIRDLSLLPDSDWNGKYGSAATQADSAVHMLTAVISQEITRPDLHEVTLSAALSRDSDGFVTEDDAEFIWTFEDGVQMVGITVVRQYDDADRHSVTLEVRHADGSSSEVTREITIMETQLLSIDFEDGITDGSSYGSDLETRGANLVEGRDGLAFELTGSSKLNIDRFNEHIHQLDTFTLSMSLQRSELEKGGMFVHFHGSMTAEILKDGRVAFALMTPVDRFVVTTDQPVLDDTNWHDLDFSYDSHAETLKIYVDEQLVGQTEASGRTVKASYFDLVIGNTWKESAKALIDNISLTKAAEPDFVSDGIDAPPPPPKKPAHSLGHQHDAGDVIAFLNFEGTLEDVSGNAAEIERKGVNLDDLEKGSIGQGLELDADSKLTVSRWNDEIHEMDSFSIGVSLRREDLDEGGAFLWLHKSLQASIEESGHISFSLYTNEGAFELFSDAPVISNTDWHRVVVSYDGAAGSLALFVDGEVVAQTQASGTTAPKSYFGLTLGHPWGQSMEGSLDEFVFLADGTDAASVTEDYAHFVQTLGKKPADLPKPHDPMNGPMHGPMHEIMPDPVTELGDAVLI